VDTGPSGVTMPPENVTTGGEVQKSLVARPGAGVCKGSREINPADTQTLRAALTFTARTLLSYQQEKKWRAMSKKRTDRKRKEKGVTRCTM